MPVTKKNKSKIKMRKLHVRFDNAPTDDISPFADFANFITEGVSVYGGDENTDDIYLKKIGGQINVIFNNMSDDNESDDITVDDNTVDDNTVDDNTVVDSATVVDIFNGTNDDNSDVEIFNLKTGDVKEGSGETKVVGCGCGINTNTIN